MLGVAAENWAEPCKGPVDCAVITCVQFDLLGGTGRAFRLTLLEVNGNGEENGRNEALSDLRSDLHLPGFWSSVCDLH